MQFLTIALFVGAALAGRTVYETDIVTITSCAPTVTDCPAHSTVTKTTSHAVPAVTHASVSAGPHPIHNGTHYTAPHAAPHNTGAAPSVVTVTVNACPSSSKTPVPVAPVTLSSVVVPYPSGTAPAVVVKPTATSAPSASAASPSPSTFTGAASPLQGSMALAGFAGLAAVLFA